MVTEKDILKYALQNAVRFDGKANPGAVIGKIIQLDPKNKDDIKKIAKDVNRIIREISTLSVDEQKARLKDIDPKMLEKKKKVARHELPELKNAVKGKVVTRLPPEPSKYAHIGHGLSFLINYMYAKKYDGRCILKFEDTNPEKCTKEFSDSMEDDLLNYLEIKPDEIIYISDHMDYMYEKAEKLIEDGKAYVCTCEREEMRDLRHKGEPCLCRSLLPEENFLLWRDMHDKRYKEGQAVLRLKGDMQSLNHVMRDPVLFRISYAKHFRHGNRYCVWPLYDFENPVMDCKYGVTHILRSSEFGKMRNELQNHIKSLFGWKPQVIKHYGRFNIIGAITSGREIRKLIEEGKVTGWDDPSLVTLKALKRRGIVKEALYELVYKVGLSLAPTNIDFTIISTLNRQILDKEAERYFFISEPQKITIRGAPEQEISLKVHPESTKSTRKFKTSTGFLIEKEDLKKIKEDKLVRLLDCLNFRKKGKSYLFDSLEYERYKDHGDQIIHWLPDDDSLVDVQVRMPDNRIIKGRGEGSLKKLKVGSVIQFQRFGFCRLDRAEEDHLLFWFTHK